MPARQSTFIAASLLVALAAAFLACAAAASPGGFAPDAAAPVVLMVCACCMGGLLLCCVSLSPAAPECEAAGAALRRVALLERVQHLNYYLGDAPEQHWRNVFPTDEDLADWIGPAWNDRALRAQMVPGVAARVQAAVAATGRA